MYSSIQMQFFALKKINQENINKFVKEKLNLLI